MAKRSINEILEQSRTNYGGACSYRFECSRMIGALREARTVLKRFNHTQGYVPLVADWNSVDDLLKKWGEE